jgi:acid stress chaperone HdeB
MFSVNRHSGAVNAGAPLWLRGEMPVPTNGGIESSLVACFAALVPTPLRQPTPGDSTMKFLLAATVAATILTAPTARAETLDLSLISCKAFIEMKPDQTAVILAWLHGYYREEHDPPIIEVDKFKQDLTKFGSYCAANQSSSIITAADKVFAK